MMNMGATAAVLLALAAAAHLLTEPALALTCGDVDASLSPCVAYLTGAQPEPAAGCCAGITKLKSMAAVATTIDKRFACDCMKTAAAHLENLKDDAVAALPAKCSTPLPFPISLDYDCSKIPQF